MRHEAQAVGSEMIQQGARDTENQRRRKRRLEERRAQDYTLNVPEVEGQEAVVPESHPRALPHG